MKKYFYLMAFACATGFLTACSSDDDNNTTPTPTPEVEKCDTITFEGTYWNALVDNAQYGGKLLYGESGSGYAEDKGVYEWTDPTTSLHSKLNNGYGTWCYWSGGVAVSNYHGAVADGSSQTQLSIPSDLKAHSGSNFLMAYGYTDANSSGSPIIDFKDGKARKVKGLWVTNGTYFLNVMANGNDYCLKASPTTKISVVFEGFKADGTTSAGTVKYTLQEGTTSLTDWAFVDLSSLGAISKLKLNYEWTKDMEGTYGYNAPAYVAVDDVVVEK